MSAGTPDFSGAHAPRRYSFEPAMTESSKAPHLAAVSDQAPAAEGAPRLTKPSIPELERYATVLRIDCVGMLAVAKSGHLDSSLSAADIVAALYYRVLRHDPDLPNW